MNVFHALCTFCVTWKAFYYKRMTCETMFLFGLVPLFFADTVTLWVFSFFWGLVFCCLSVCFYMKLHSQKKGLQTVKLTKPHIITTILDDVYSLCNIVLLFSSLLNWKSWVHKSKFFEKIGSFIKVCRHIEGYLKVPSHEIWR